MIVNDKITIISPYHLSSISYIAPLNKFYGGKKALVDAKRNKDISHF